MAAGLLLALAQLNPVMGDIAGNLAKLRAVRADAAHQKADLLMLPEMYLSGYPAEDLLLKPSFMKAIEAAVQSLLQDTTDGGPAILLGTPWLENGKLYNACLLLDQGKIAAKIFKRDLPDYGPFDDKRVFTAGDLPEPINFRGGKLGVLICEDLWTPHVATHLKNQGAEILLSPNGSPYETDKQTDRMKAAQKRVHETGLPFVYLNQIGGQDELVFDGSSFVLDAKGVCIAEEKSWAEDLLYYRHSRASGNPEASDREHMSLLPHRLATLDSRLRGNDGVNEQTTYNALMLGLRDYLNKNGFKNVVLGLSGGIDSAIVATLAVDAVGAENVWCVMLPSPYTSDESHEDAAALARNLKCRYDTIPITDAMNVFSGALKDVFADKSADLTEENIQARCRGVMLMALSNKFGNLLLSTGNKSEMAVGYSTLYGDLCGGFAPLKDVYKTEVYKIARWRNTQSVAIIPERILTKAPTAELRPNQTDQDSLPPYEILDGILKCLIEKDLGIAETIACGFDAATVQRVSMMLHRAEYKRRQAPPGVKVTRRMLGKDRRYPITNRYRETD